MSTQPYVIHNASVILMIESAGIVPTGDCA